MKKALIIFSAVILFCSTSFAESFPAVKVYQKTSKAVVLIITHTSGRGRMVGAGSIIDHSGTIVTNAHVVLNRSKSAPQTNIKVYFKPDKVTGNLGRDLTSGYKARVEAYDALLDLAILKADNIPSETGVIKLADPEDIKIGEEVVTIGHPEQGGLWTLSYGRISGEIINQKNIEGKDMYQTDASVNRGNSGGPLLDRRGYMAGINTNIARIGAGNLPITGVNFALKSSVIKKWIHDQGITLAYGSQSYSHKQSAADNVNDIQEASKDQIVTPGKPYTFDALFRETEKELEDMMEEMRGRIREQ